MTRLNVKRHGSMRTTRSGGTTHMRRDPAYLPGGPGTRPRRTVRVGARTLRLVWMGARRDGYGFHVMDGDAWIGIVCPLHRVTRFGGPYPEPRTKRPVLWQAIVRSEVRSTVHAPLLHDWPPIRVGTVHRTRHDALLRLVASAVVTPSPAP